MRPLHHKYCIVVILSMICKIVMAQSFPTTPGFTLPPGKTIVITYSVDVNSDACPDGEVAPMNLSNQSNVSGSNFTTIQTHELNLMMPDPTLTAFAGITLGDMVFFDQNSNGIFDGMDAGIDGVLINVYVDDGNGTLGMEDMLPIANTTTSGGGMYSFHLCPGSFIVEVDPSNFLMGGALYNNMLNAAMIPSGAPANPADGLNNVNHGSQIMGFGVASTSIDIDYGGGVMGTDDFLHLDFAFQDPTTVTINDPMVAEGNTGDMNTLTFTITRSDNVLAFDLDVAVTGGTATSGIDFIAPVQNTISFTAAGNLTASFEITITGDQLVELDETIEVTISNSPSNVIISKSLGTGTIENDDMAGISVSNVSNLEANGPFVFDITLTNPVDVEVTMDFSTSDGTAIVVDNDYVAVAAQQVSFAA
ncbi:MAG TPA: SdrD B-like domain-containing protein, partial [Saprospiraceae bacterium]|nr:SdrD B-like domain-containing protein [Saprospiraceae bacterium]